MTEIKLEIFKRLPTAVAYFIDRVILNHSNIYMERVYGDHDGEPDYDGIKRYLKK